VNDKLPAPKAGCGKLTALTGTIHWPNVIPLRGLVDPISELRVDGRTPFWAAIGLAVESIGEFNKERLRRIRRVLRVLYPDLYTKYRTWGLLNLPRVLGGTGLPPVRGDPTLLGSVPRFVRRGLVPLLYG